MDDLEFQFKSRQPVLDHETSLLENVLKNSTGKPAMSPEDMKLAVLALQGLAHHQLQLIEVLGCEIQELKKAKKTIFQKIFRK